MSIRLGFVGAGNHARLHMRHFGRLAGAALALVYDLNPDHARAAAHDFPALCPATDLNALLKSNSVDAVVIATPAETHAELACAALAAGKHVLLEKPIAHTPESARAICEAAEAHPELVLLVGHCERFNCAYREARQAVASGALGEPRFAWSSRLSPLKLNNPDWKLGTLDTAIHDLDLMSWLIGSRPLSISAQGAQVNPDSDIYDHVCYLVRFENGALAQGHIGWVPFSANYPLGQNAHPRLFMAGSGGSLSLDLWQRPVSVDSRKQERYFWPDDVLLGYAGGPTAVTVQNEAFLRAIQGREPLPISPREACLALGMAHAAHASLAEDGNPISIR